MRGDTATKSVVIRWPALVVGPLLDVADLLRGLRVDLLQRLEELLAHRVGQDAEEVGAVVGRHLAGDVRATDSGGICSTSSSCSCSSRRSKMGAASSAGRRASSCARLVRLELADDVGEVLGVDLVEQLPDAVGVLFEELLDVRAEQGARGAWRLRAA